MRGVKHAGIIAAVTAITLVVTGCVPGGGNDAALNRSLFMGAIPDPMPFTSVLGDLAGMPEMPDMDTMPEMPSDPTDEAAMEAYMKAIEEWYSQIDMDALEEMANDPALGEEAVADAKEFTEELEPIIEAASAGGEEALAAWQTLYVLSGVAVTGNDGDYVEIGERSGSGVPVSDAELRIWALQPAGAEISLGNVAGMLASRYGDESQQDAVAEALYEGAVLGSDSEFTMVLTMLGPQGQFVNGSGIVPTADIMLTLPQMNLILRRLAAEIDVTYGLKEQPSALGPDSGFSIHTAALPMAAPKPCEISDPWAANAVKVANGLGNWQVFGRAMTLLTEMPGWSSMATSAELGLSVGAALLSLLAVAAKIMALQADISLANGPLVRTKDRKPGEVRDLNVTMTFDGEVWEDMRRCTALFLGSIGVDGAPNSGAAGLQLDIRSDDPSRMRVGDGTGANPTGMGVNRAMTDTDGKATFKLSGAPHKMTLPDTATPDETTIKVRVDSNLQNNDLYGDFLSMAAGLSSAGLGTLIEGAVQSVARMRFMSYTKPIDFKDWYVYAEFDVTLTGQVKGYRASNMVYSQYAECGAGPYYSSRSVDGIGSVAPGDPTRIQAILVTNPDDSYDQIPLFTELDVEVHELFTSNNGVALFPLEGAFTVDKQAADPAVGPLPELEDGGVMGCGDGDPSKASPQEPDCGTRSFGNALTVHQLDKGFIVTGTPLDGVTWRRCGGSLPVQDGLVPVGVDTCTNMSRVGGGLPAINDVFDAKKTLIEVTGTLECSRNEPGSLMTYEFSWTMEFCRIVEGERAC